MTAVLKSAGLAWIGRRCIDAVMGILLMASISKLIDLSAFARTLETWTLVLPGLRQPLAVGVPTCELAVAALWFARLRRPFAILTAAFLLSSFTAVYALQRTFAQPPTCGCLGLWVKFRSVQESSLSLFFKNGLLLALLGAGAIYSRFGASSPDRAT